MTMSPGSAFPYPSFRFDEIAQAPDRPGIYAWYHQVRLSKADVDDFIQRAAAVDGEARAARVESYLRDRVFEPYRESPYQIALRGGLKPEYGGHVAHQPRVSRGTVETLAARPEGMREVSALLTKMVPVFASPIYIGVATRSLRTRLTQHAKLIEEYRERPPASVPDDEGHSFAFEAVCERGLRPLELVVYVIETPVSSEIQLVAEYIFNRINYPLCGRR